MLELGRYRSPNRTSGACFRWSINLSRTPQSRRTALRHAPQGPRANRLAGPQTPVATPAKRPKGVARWLIRLRYFTKARSTPRAAVGSRVPASQASTREARSGEARAKASRTASRRASSRRVRRKAFGSDGCSGVSASSGRLGLRSTKKSAVWQVGCGGMDRLLSDGSHSGKHFPIEWAIEPLNGGTWGAQRLEVCLHTVYGNALAGV